MFEAPAAKRAKVDQHEVSALEAIKFKLLAAGDGNSTPAADFAPAMVHQLFGEDELIKGHENPAATVWVSSTTFETAVEFQSTAKERGATEVKQILEQNFPVGLLADRTQLLLSHSTSNALNTGVLGEPILTRVAAEEQVSVHHFTLSTAPELVKTLHARMQQLLCFFIDGATPLDQSEPDWDLLLAVRQKSGTNFVIGLCTLYRLYAYPVCSRLRISQLFVLPPFHKQGVGRALLQAVYKLADTDKLQDVIYEEPTDVVQALRERIELERALAVPWLVELARQHSAASVAMNGSAGSQAPTSLALNVDEIAKAQKELRISRQQVRRIWELMLVQQPSFLKEPGADVLRGLVARRLFGSFADTKQQAVGKQIFTFDEVGSFCMRKVPVSDGIKGAPVALEDKQEEGQSAEERIAALDQAVEERMAFLLQLTGAAC